MLILGGFVEVDFWGLVDSTFVHPCALHLDFATDFSIDLVGAITPLATGFAMDTMAYFWVGWITVAFSSLTPFLGAGGVGKRVDQAETNGGGTGFMSTVLVAVCLAAVLKTGPISSMIFGMSPGLRSASISQLR